MGTNIQREKEVIAELSARLALAERKEAELVNLRDLQDFDYKSSLESLREVFGGEAVNRELRVIKYDSLSGLIGIVRDYNDLTESIVSRLDPKLNAKMVNLREGFVRKDRKVNNYYNIFVGERNSVEGIKLPFQSCSSEIETKIGENGYTISGGIFFVPKKEREPNVDSASIDKILTFVVEPPYSTCKLNYGGFQLCYWSKNPIYHPNKDYGLFRKGITSLFVSPKLYLRFKDLSSNFQEGKLKQIMRSLIDDDYADFVKILIGSLNRIPELTAEYLELRNNQLLEIK